MSDMPALFIYYKPPAPDAALQQRIRSMQAACTAAGLCRAARLMHRMDDAGTWMEIYDDVGDRATLEAALEAAAAPLAGATGNRHAEWFVAMTPSK